MASLMLVVALTAGLSGCLDREGPDVPDFDEEAQLEEDIMKIQAYLRENGRSAMQTETGLFVEVTNATSGRQPANGDEVVVDYIGYTLNDRVFDTSKSLVAQGNNIWDPARDYEPIEFAVGTGRVIEGWDQGLLLLNEGSSAILYIPSGLAYGRFGTSGGQFRNEVLIFEVDLLDVK